MLILLFKKDMEPYLNNLSTLAQQNYKIIEIHV